MRQMVLAALALALAQSAAAQVVGYPPDRSPFRDLEFRQEIGGYTGYYAAGADRVGVAPQSGPLVGVRYEVRVGGPAQFTARAARVWSERKVLDPNLPAGERDLGTREWPLYLADVSLTVNLTGQKSFHHIVPVFNAGVGVASDFKGADRGDFKFGTQFALSFGGGVKWVVGSQLELRADVADYLYQISYPQLYLDKQVVSDTRSDWTQNWAFTVGAAYRFFR